MKHILHIYEEASGQAVNDMKSCMAFSKNINEYDDQLLADYLGMA